VPASFCLHDITALLPCEESEFAFGEVRNKKRALSEHRSLKDKPLDIAEHFKGMIMDDERAIALSCFLWC
jgi:hypothetical protein